MAVSAQSLQRSANSTQRLPQDAFGSMTAGLATALQCCEDGMGERLALLAQEQLALLAKLEAARKSLPLQLERGYGTHSNSSNQQYVGGNSTDAEDDVAYISQVMNQAPWYMHRVHALAAKKDSLANRVRNLERRSAALRESLPVPMPQHMQEEMARWRAGVQPFHEQADMGFVVCYRGGVAIRVGPHVDAPCVGEVLEWEEEFWATERLGRLGEETIYVRLRDGRGWVFESVKGMKVLQRMAPCTTPPRQPGSSPDEGEHEEADAND